MKISIIIPVYNVEKYLLDCLRSIIENCDMNDTEIVLIDDGSSDESGKIADAFCAENRNAVIVHQKNSGQGAARNIGITLARGEYCYFLDSDDTLYGDFYSKVLPLLSKNFDVILSDTMIERDDRTKEIFRKKAKINSDDYTALISDFMEQSNGSVCQGVYKTELIKKHNIYFSEKRDICEDDTWLVIFFQSAKSAEIVSEPFFIYRTHRKNSTTNKVKESVLVPTIQETLKVVESLDKSKFTNVERLKVRYANRLLDYLLQYRNVTSKEIRKEIQRHFIQNFKFLKKGNQRVTRFLNLKYILGSSGCLKVMGQIRYFANRTKKSEL